MYYIAATKKLLGNLHTDFYSIFTIIRNSLVIGGYKLPNKLTYKTIYMPDDSQ